MKTNVYWAVAAKGGVLRDTFDLAEWQEAFDYNQDQLNRLSASFSFKPSWNFYEKLGGCIQRAENLMSLIQYVAVVLPGVSETERQRAYLNATRLFHVKLYAVRDLVCAFLSKEKLSGSQENKRKAVYEQKHWDGVSPKKTACTQLEQKLAKEGDLVHFDHLSGIRLYPALHKKGRERAMELGLDGHVIDPTDTTTVDILNEEKNERMRKHLWMTMQTNLPISPKETKKLIGVREDFARSNGFENYASFIERFDRGLSFKTVERQIVKSLKAYSAPYMSARGTETLYGAKKSAWNTAKDGDITQPWNQSYLSWKFQETTLDLQGKEFPLKRVLETIIPDIMLMNGWNTTAIQKIGRGKKCLYMYRFCKNGKSAILYLAPYPLESNLESDTCQAYAAMLRERFTGSKPTTPIAFIASNLVLKKGGLSDIDQLSFLSHELGHVMHFFSLPGKTFKEFERIPTSISELPSIMLERIASDNALLQKWCNPAFKSGKKNAYWQRRKPKINIHADMNDLERSYLDIKAHRENNPLLDKMQNELRQKVGLPFLHKKDKSAFASFDRTETAGLYSCYFTARALTSSVLGNSFDSEKIARATDFLIDEVLSFNDNIESNWKRAYGKTLCATFWQGQQTLDKAFVRHLKAKDRSIKSKMNKAKTTESA